MLTMALVVLITLCESGVLECLPEFKGTYDEDQEQLLAVDWSANEERDDLRRQIRERGNRGRR